MGRYGGGLPYLGLKELFFVDKAKTPLEIGTYFRPQGRNFPAIDSWLLVRPTPPKPSATQEPLILLRPQVTVGKDKRNVKESGLGIVEKLDEKGVKKYLVIVTPKGRKPT